ncbi:MAG: PDZ domain-containing protein [candidate division Zixibacteria bacterium]|nr:PDZ domain-containing protein [candidate division Zixibacteria bacterium]
MILILLFLFTTSNTSVRAQQFDFDRLQEKAYEFTVIVEMKLEVSFGVHSSEQEARYSGSIVSEDGLVMFNGTDLANDNAHLSFAGFSVRTNPIRIKVKTFDGRSYDAELQGIDRFTRIGFVRIVGAGGEKFTPVEFRSDCSYEVGSWLTLYMLLPDFIQPPLAADVGMVSSIIESPEFFPLTVGFNSLQATSVLFNENLEPVGILGKLVDPLSAGMDASGIMESMGQYGMPLLGVITGERLKKIIADPPTRGESGRGWLGIRLQALTEEIAQFWNLGLSGGVIVNEIIKGSPADSVGLAVGDIIFKVNDQRLDVDQDENIPVFQRLISEMNPGTAIEISVIRSEGRIADTINLVAVLKNTPMAAIEAPEYENETLEFKVRDLVFDDYVFLNQDPETFKGVVVSELKRGGLSSVGGLRFGDVIQRIGEQQVISVDEMETIMEQIENNRPREVIFFVWRDNQTMFINIKTD